MILFSDWKCVESGAYIKFILKYQYVREREQIEASYQLFNLLSLSLNHNCLEIYQAKNLQQYANNIIRTTFNQ